MDPKSTLHGDARPSINRAGRTSEDKGHMSTTAKAYAYRSEETATVPQSPYWTPNTLRPTIAKIPQAAVVVRVRPSCNGQDPNDLSRCRHVSRCRSRQPPPAIRTSRRHIDRQNRETCLAVLASGPPSSSHFPRAASIPDCALSLRRRQSTI